MFNFKPDLDQTMQRMDAFWEGSVLDRPVVQFYLEKPQAKQINVSVDASEHYAINNAATTFNTVQNMSQMLRTAAGEQKDPTIIINADAKAPHQAVINIMEAARLAGYGRITFTTSRK